MFPALRCVYIVLTITAFALVAEAKDWRGLLPLRSTREDVVQMMGEWQWAPAGRTTIYEPLTDSDPYYLAEGEVYFSYAPRIDERHDSLPRGIAPGTLLTIRFTPNTPLDWTELSVNRAAFHKLDGGPGENGFGRYADDADGLIVRIKAEKILELIYLPRGEDREPFARYFDTLEKQDSSTNATGDMAERGQTTEGETARSNEPGTDESTSIIDYGVVICRLPEFDPKRVLDRAVFDLSENPVAKGSITIYPDLRENPNEFQLERDRVLDYLVNVRGIDRSRLLVSDGGRSLGTWFEIVVVPADAELALPTPEAPSTEGEPNEPLDREFREPPTNTAAAGQFGNRPKISCGTPALLLYGSDDNANLDVFAVQLSSYPSSRGYIVIYRASDERPDEAELQVTRALDYLATEKGIDRSRLFVLDGGPSDVTFSELWVVPEGAEPPTLGPTDDGQDRPMD